MTVALERPMSPAVDSTLADDIKHLIDNLPQHTYDIERDYQEILGCEVILIDDRSYHWQIEIHSSGEIEALHQKYLESGELQDISFVTITALPQFTALIEA